ncbi:nitroreductase/quinone reductase family protein [Cellulomonas sp. ICMP 17802]|uniref:nitroreductase/quinone reductase family protein n=1 Tax=Cellulomonas sp. ICMP 17802 TaxID=3239199 RepID=UPI00351BD632
MSFSYPVGTRGARQPRGPLFRWVNDRTANRVRRRRDGRFMGLDALVLNTVGRKSGQERATPLGWFPGEPDGWVVIAAAAGGARNPAWYLNAAAQPDRLTIDLAGQTIPVSARELHGDEREAAWARVTAAVPRFATYQRKTDRQLPVILLTPREVPPVS